MADLDMYVISDINFYLQILGYIFIYPLLFYLGYQLVLLFKRGNKAIDIYLKKRGITIRLSRLYYIGVFITLLIIISGLFILPRFAIYTFLKTEMSPEKAPNSYVVPEELEIRSREIEKDKKIMGEYISFENPWGNFRVEEDMGEDTIYCFDDNVRFLIGKPVEQLNLYKMYKPILLGTFDIDNDYELYKYQYQLTPENINYLLFLPQIVLKVSLLINKDVFLISNKYVYFFELKNLKGFQYGNPELVEIISLEIYDNTGKQYSCYIQGNINQKDINLILSTIKFRR